MIAQDPTSKPRKPNVRIPYEVRLELKHEIAAHLRLHGSAHYDRLREDPRFSPYIGAQLGETGDKRLDRLIAEVRRTVPSARRQRGPAEPAQNAAAEGLGGQGALPSSAPVIISPSAMISGAAPVQVAIDQLQGLVQRRLPELERAIGACMNDLGELVDHKFYLKLVQEQRATVQAVATLTDRLQAQLGSARFISGLMGLVDRLAGTPEGREVARNEVRALAAECGGLLPLTGDT